jgi:hypothetical protein
MEPSALRLVSTVYFSGMRLLPRRDAMRYITPHCTASTHRSYSPLRQVISCAHRFFVIRNTGSTHLSWSTHTHAHTHTNTHTTPHTTHPHVHTHRSGDNTSSQMHNSYLMMYNNELCRTDGFGYFHRLDNKYPPPGHTFMGHLSQYVGKLEKGISSYAS